MKTNIAVFFGCRSVEHEVSIISAVQAMRAINREKYDVTPIYVTKNGEMYTGENLFTIENYRDLPALLKAAEPVTFIKQGGSVFMKYLNSGLFSKKKDVQVDLAFPVVHGTNCEDGTMAGYFEFLGLPYISCDILSAAVGMDKAVFKEVLKSAGLPVLGCVTFRSREYMTDKAAVTAEITEKIGFPLIIKPVNLGSSVGITKATNREQLKEAIQLALANDRKVVFEAFVDGHEVECAVIGSDPAVATRPGEILAGAEFYTYDDKYKNGVSQTVIPAHLPEEKLDEVKTYAAMAYTALNCEGLARCDFFVEKNTGRVLINEINTFPGFTAISMYPKLMEHEGLPVPQLIDRLIALAVERTEKQHG